MEQRGARESGLEHRQHLVHLRHARALRHRPGDDLVVVEVHHRGEVRLAPGLAELGDVRDQLAHRRVRAEVPGQDVAGGPALLAPVGAVPLPPDPAAQALLAHELERGLARDAEALLVPQRERDLAVAHAVGRAREDLVQQRPDVGVAVGLRVPAAGVAVVRRPGQPQLPEDQVERVSAPQRVGYLGFRPSAKAFIRFWISSSSSSSRTRASSSSSRLAKAGPSALRGLPLGLGSNASGPPSR